MVPEAPAGYLIDSFFGDGHLLGPAQAAPDCVCRSICWRADNALLSWLPDPV